MNVFVLMRCYDIETNDVAEIVAIYADINKAKAEAARLFQIHQGYADVFEVETWSVAE